MTDTPQPDSTRPEERCPVCDWPLTAPDYELGSHEHVNCSTRCLSCGKQRPAFMGPSRFLDANLRPTLRENTTFPLATPTPREDAVEEALGRLDSFAYHALRNAPRGSIAEGCAVEAQSNLAILRDTITSLRSEVRQLEGALDAQDAMLTDKLNAAYAEVRSLRSEVAVLEMAASAFRKLEASLCHGCGECCPECPYFEAICEAKAALTQARKEVE